MSARWDRLRADLDTDPPWDPPLPPVSYVVCSTPRSGSGLLVRGLLSTGLAGTPTEYFHPSARGGLTRRWGTGESPFEYAAALRGRRTATNGVFGTKLHWDQLLALCDELPGSLAPGQIPPRAIVDELLPGSRFVRIMRLDLQAQAVSYWVAMNSKEWSRPAADHGSPAPPTPYSFRGIERCREQIVEGILGWNHFVALNRITPIDVVYEDLAANFAAVVRRTLEEILPGVAIPEIPAPEIVKQSDEHSDALLARFRVEWARRSRRVARGGQFVLGASALRRALQNVPVGRPSVQK